MNMIRGESKRLRGNFDQRLHTQFSILLLSDLESVYNIESQKFILNISFLEDDIIFE